MFFNNYKYETKQNSENNRNSMLGCCHCLCSKEYNAYTRVDACYPTDGRAQPINARIGELINWGRHDIDRFSTIHEILAERINYSIDNRDLNNVSCGIKILSRLFESVTDLNLNFSTTLGSV